MLLKLKTKKKIPYISYQLLKNLIKNKDSKLIKTWSKNSIILPSMIGYLFQLYTGSRFIPLTITSLLVGHKLGEFVKTRKFPHHKIKNLDNKIKKKS